MRATALGTESSEVMRVSLSCSVEGVDPLLRGRAMPDQRGISIHSHFTMSCPTSKMRVELPSLAAGLMKAGALALAEAGCILGQNQAMALLDGANGIKNT
mmetsp:Transcript_92900/g.194179  ORF Transcript_92900/g.194179 Transcript_92900/m.194179 type:complete len:100 (-) Transcript_92900:205-504(-)